MHPTLNVSTLNCKKFLGVGEYLSVKRFDTSFVERADEEERKRERKRQRKSCSNRSALCVLAWRFCSSFRFIIL